MNSHLSWQPVAGTAQCHLFKAVGQTLLLYCGVAPDRVYRLPRSPEGAVSSYLAFPPLPMHAWAAYLCCTFPEAALWSPDFPQIQPFGLHSQLFISLRHALYHNFTRMSIMNKYALPMYILKKNNIRSKI